MTTNEKLDRIAAKCLELIVRYKSGTGGVPDAIASWRSTIAAIEFIQRIEYFDSRIADEILAAWEGLA